MWLAPAVLMVRPERFGFNPEAAVTNVFAQEGVSGPEDSGHTGAACVPPSERARARFEVERAAEALQSAGVRVFLAADAIEPPKPDACFPNNWVSFHPDGTAVLYPMAVASRRAERRPELLEQVRTFHGTRRVVDLSALEADGAYLEGTGSLILDHAARVAFAARSPRTTTAGLSAFSKATGYRIVAFDAALDGAPVYHTNVMLALGPELVVFAPDLVAPGAARTGLLSALGDRRQLVLEAAQIRDYAANLLYLSSPAGPVAVLSRRAFAALTASQRAMLGKTVVVDIDTVETVGGGSARCLLAEVFGVDSPQP